MTTTDIGRCLWQFERSGARIVRVTVVKGLTIIDLPAATMVESAIWSDSRLVFSQLPTAGIWGVMLWLSSTRSDM